MSSRLKQLEALAARRDEGGSSPANANLLTTDTRASPSGGQSSHGATRLTSLCPQTSKSIPSSPKEKKKKEATQTSRSKKRKAEESSFSFQDSAYWGGDWDTEEYLYAKGKEIGPLIESAKMGEWEREVAKLSMENQRLMSLAGTIAFFKSCIEALRDEKTNLIAEFEQAKKVAEDEKTNISREPKELKASNATLKTQKTGFSNQVKDLLTTVGSFEEDKTNMSSEVVKYQELFENKVVGTYESIIEQVLLFNPTAKLENIHYLHFVKNGQLMRLNENQEEELVELVSATDTEMPTPPVVPENAADIQSDAADGPRDMSIQTI